jgi:hypothetical protein
MIVLMVVGVALVGGGLWAFLGTGNNSSPEMTIAGTQVTLPEGTDVPQDPPIVVMGTQLEGAGTNEYLYIYPNKLVVDVLESPEAEQGRQWFRIWKSYVMTQGEYDELTSLISSKAGELEEEYQFIDPETQQVSTQGDRDTVLAINYQNINKNVKAANFLASYSSYYAGTYAGMPDTLAEICQKLDEVGAKAVEFYRQDR